MRSRKDTRGFAIAVAAVVGWSSVSLAAVLLRDNDALPIPEPAEDEEGQYLWWNDAWTLSFYQTGKALDLGRLGRASAAVIALAGPLEAANVSAIDEVADSTWFTNRHAHQKLSREDLARGAAHGEAPAEGPLTVVSGKSRGEVPGFMMKDTRGSRYLVKFDPPEFPEMGTGAELVSSRIVHALGWYVPDYYLVRIDPSRLVLADDATIEDEYNRERPMRRRDLDDILGKVARSKDGTFRASASLFLPGKPKGPFLMQGMRADDPNDTVPHEHRRDLRGFRVVAGWINHTDFRPANTLDVFVRDDADPPGHGHLVHYLLDFSSTLGSADLEWKKPRLGTEYQFDPPVILANVLTLGFWVKEWEDNRLVHPTIGFLRGASHDPEEWVAEFPSPAFDRATFRDLFWGAKLVASLDEADLGAIVDGAEWSDPAAGAALLERLVARRKTILAAFFDFRRLNPLDRFAVAGERLESADLAVEHGLVSPPAARYRSRIDGGDWVVAAGPAVPLPARRLVEVELETSHDGGESWSPTTSVTVRRTNAGAEVIEIERETS